MEPFDAPNRVEEIRNAVVVRNPWALEELLE